jgi:outer membrane protein assembly factor BamA
MVALSLGRVDDRGREEFKFTRFAVDARGYLPLGSPQRVLALRAYTSLDDPAEGDRVPFYMQETLGTSHLLRGFPTFRFRGPKLLALQAEYRWEAIPALELAAFVDSGKVFDDMADFDLDGLETSYGFGLRLKSTTATLVRFDVAKSPEDTRLHLRFGAAF